MAGDRAAAQGCRPAALAHEALFYTGVDELLSGTVPFVVAAACAEEPVLCPYDVAALPEVADRARQAGLPPDRVADWLAGRVRPAADSERGCGLLLANRMCDLIQTYTRPESTVTRLHMWR